MESNICVVIAKGEFKTSIHSSALESTLNHIKQIRCEKIIFDLRALETKEKKFNIEELPDVYEKVKVPKHFQMIYLLNSSFFDPSQYKTFENAYAKRGYMIQVVESLEIAESILKGE